MTTKTIHDVLAGRPLLKVDMQTSLRDTAKMLMENKVGAVAVVSDDQLKGIVTERDIVFRGVAQDLSMDDTTAEDIMTREPTTVDSRDAISDALAVKLGDRFRHLPVMESGTVVGIISFRDIPAEYVVMFEMFRKMSTSRADEY